MPIGWVGSDRSSRYPADWQQRRLVVLKRDHYRCQHIREDTGKKCGRRANQVDHIIQGADDDRLEALQALCEWHHLRKSSREGGLASGRARRAQRAAAKPLHPGLLDTPIDRTPPPF